MSFTPPVGQSPFLDTLRASGLLGEEFLAPVLQALPDGAGEGDVAAALVGAGVLTLFQADRLLAGNLGDLWLGPYRVLGQVGRGSVGRVYRAVHRTLGRVVALKVLSPGLLDTDRARELFAREVQAVARLDHPNVVAAYDAGVDGGRDYLVLEYVDGPDLARLVRRCGPLPVSVACACAAQVACGLACAHAAGMVHRDVKPSNVLLQRRGPGGVSPGLTKLGDFGLARLHAPGTAPAGSAGTLLAQANAILGTPDYLAPEQARDVHGADARSDLYGLGGTLYFLLSGRVPFPGGTLAEKVVRHSCEEPEPLERLRPDVPPAVAAVVARLLAKRPGDRPQAAAEVADLLRPFAAGGPVSWPPPGTSGEEDRGPCGEPGEDAEDSGSMSCTLAGGSPPGPPALPEPLRLRRQLSARDRRAFRERVRLAVLGAILIVSGLLAAGLLTALLAGA
jgi:serine/threonine-protein kinase